MITSAVIFTVVAAIVMVSLAFYTRSMAAVDARGQLSEARYHFDLQAREIDALILGFAEWDAFYQQTAHLEEAFISREFDPWLTDRANASVVVWADADDATINSSGDAADIEALLELGRRNPDGARGVVSLPTGPAVIAVRPIIGDPPAGPVGTLAVGRSISNEDLSSEGWRDIVLIPDTRPLEETDGWHSMEPPRGYAAAVTQIRDGQFLTQSSILGVDGKTAFTLELSRPDPWLGEGRAWYVYLLPLALGIVTLGVGYLLGNALGRSIGRPLHRFVTYLQDQGYLALQGLRTDHELVVDPGLPEDFTELGRVITDLMTQLRINQSEIIEAGDQAQAAEQAFRTVVEESPEVKILVRGGVVEIANPAAAHFFGLRLGDLLRADPEGLFSGVQLYDEDDKPLELLHIAGEAQDAPVVARVVAPEQPDRWIELSVALVDSIGADYVISARNITEERRLEALRKEVLSLVSHDLRSPLTVMRGYLDILDRPLDDDRRQIAVESARRACLRMEGLLDDLLGATRAEAVFAPKVMRPVDLSLLAEGVASALQMGAEQDIVASVQPGVTVLGDPVRLEQAITNLIGNAIKHGPADGTVRVSVSTDGARVVLDVQDEGPGIPTEQRETIFERGARGEDSHGVPGMGLGLYIVRTVAEGHGGLAFVDDSDSGTRLVLELPAMQFELETD